MKNVKNIGKFIKIKNDFITFLKLKNSKTKKSKLKNAQLIAYYQKRRKFYKFRRIKC